MIIEMQLSGEHAGGRRVVSSRMVGSNGGDSEADFDLPEGIVVNSDASLAYVIDRWHGAVIEVQLNGEHAGDRRVVSSRTVGSNGGDSEADFMSPIGIALNDDASRAYIVDGNRRQAVIEVVLSGENVGDRRVVSNHDNGAYVVPTGIAISNKGVAWVIDSTWDALFAVELTSGDRVIVSK